MAANGEQRLPVAHFIRVMLQIMIELNIQNELKAQGLAVGVIAATGVTVGPSPVDLRGVIEACIGAKGFASEARRTAVRDLLRRGGFKPSGRNKPASEYLVQA